MGRKKKAIVEEKENVDDSAEDSQIFMIDPDQKMIEASSDLDVESEESIQKVLNCESLSVIPIWGDSAIIVNGDALNEEGLNYFHLPFLALPVGGRAVLIGEFNYENLKESIVYMSEKEADTFRRKKFGQIK